MEDEELYMFQEKDHLYGEVVFQKDNVTVRKDGLYKPVYSVWYGDRLEFTSLDEEAVKRFMR